MDHQHGPYAFQPLGEHFTDMTSQSMDSSRLQTSKMATYPINSLPSQEPHSEFGSWLGGESFRTGAAFDRTTTTSTSSGFDQQLTSQPISYLQKISPSEYYPNLTAELSPSIHQLSNASATSRNDVCALKQLHAHQFSLPHFYPTADIMSKPAKKAKNIPSKRDILNVELKTLSKPTKPVKSTRPSKIDTLKHKCANCNATQTPLW